MKDYYQILGVSRQSSAADIRRAYRKLVQKLHPDINPEPDAQVLIREVNEAYEVLSDPVKRQAYHERLDNPFIIQVEPEPPHRDPAYRRRSRPHVKSEPDDQLELKKKIISKSWILYLTGMVISLLLAVDFFIEPVTSSEVITGFRSERFRRSYQNFLQTSSGREMKIAYEDRLRLRQGQPIVIESSGILSIERKAIAGDEDKFVLTNLGTLYGNFAFVPILLGISSLLGLASGRFTGVEFRFNLVIANAFLLIFTVILILIR